jgi:hypothetical protein
MAKELLRMQMLAGIITESQYNEKMNEEEGEKVDFDQIASELAGELKLNPGEVDKSMDLVDEAKINEDYLTGVAEGPEVIAGAVALAGGIIGAVIGYLKWSKNANLRDYVEQQATFIVQDEMKKLGLTPNEVGKDEMKKLVKSAVTDLRKNPEFMKKAQLQTKV